MSVKGNESTFSDGFDFGIQESNELSSAQMFSLLDGEDTPTPKKKVAEKIEDADDKTEEISAKETEEVNLLDQLQDGEEEKEEKAEEKEESEEKEEDEINPFSAIAKNLFELGIFTQEEDDEEHPIENGEELRDRFEYEKKKAVHNILDNFLARKGEEYKEMFEAVFINGVHPKEYLQTYSSIQDFQNADLTDVDVQKQVVIEGLRLQGFEDEDIKSELKEMEEYGTLEDKAKKYHKVVVKKQEEKLKEIQETEKRKVQEEARKDASYRESLNKILSKKLETKEFDNIPVTEDFAKETFDYLYTKKWKTPAGKLITDFEKEMLELDSPENYERKVKIGLLLNLLKKDPELKTIQKKAISKSSNTLFSELAEKQVKKVGVEKPKPTSWFNK